LRSADGFFQAASLLRSRVADVENRDRQVIDSLGRRHRNGQRNRFGRSAFVADGADLFSCDQNGASRPHWVNPASTRSDISRRQVERLRLNFEIEYLERREPPASREQSALAADRRARA